MATVVVPTYSPDWRHSYAGNRYLEFLSVGDLRQRYIDLLDNILAFNAHGCPHLEGLNVDTGWTRRAADVWAEADLRDLGPTWLRSVEQEVLDRPYPKVKRAIEAWGRRRFEAERNIIKYGRRDHMADLVQRGRMRLTPASDYDDLSFSPAIRDSELEFSTYFPRGTKISVELSPGSKNFENIPGNPDLPLEAIDSTGTDKRLDNAKRSE